MIFYPAYPTKKAVINGVIIPVPSSIKYVTINMNRIVQGWSSAPILTEGFWDSPVCEPIRLGIVDLNEEDDIFKLWDVK